MTRTIVGISNALVVLLSVLAGLHGWRAHLEAERRPVAFTASVFGERETAPGIWEPLDLTSLREVAPEDRFQVRVRAEDRERLYVYAIHRGGRVQRLLGGAGTRPFAAGESVVLPAARHFYRVEGGALGLVIAAAADGVDAEGRLAEPAALAATAAHTEALAFAPWSVRLSDGRGVQPGAVRVEGERLVVWRIALEAGGGGGLKAPAAPTDGAGGEALLAGGTP